MSGLFNKRPQRSSSDYVNDAMRTPPSTWQTIKHNFSSDFATVGQMGADLYSLLSDHQTKTQEDLDNYIKAVERENSIPGQGLSQEAGQYIGSIAGFAADPINWLGGWAAGGVEKVGGHLLGKVAESFGKTATDTSLRHSITKLPSSVQNFSTAVSQAGKQASKGAVYGGVGFGLPEGVVHNYKYDSNNVDWGGVTRSMRDNGVFGALLGSVGYTLGIGKAKINSSKFRRKDTKVTNEEAQEEVQKQTISPEMGQYISKYNDYLNKEQPTKDDYDELIHLKNLALNGENVKHDQTTNTVPVEMGDPKDMKDLTAAGINQVLAKLPDNVKDHYPEFIGDRMLKRIEDHDTHLDGIRGAVEEMNRKLENKDEFLSKMEKSIEPVLKQSMRHDWHLSHKDLLRHLKNNKVDPGELGDVPHHIPDEVKKHFQANKELQRLRNKKSRLKKKGESTDEIDQQIKKINEEKPDLKHPKDELRDIKQKLYHEDWEGRDDQNHSVDRLSELAEHWKPASHLQDLITQKFKYEKEEGIRDFFSQIVNSADTRQRSSTQGVESYLKHMRDVTKYKDEDVEDPSDAIKEILDQASYYDRMLRDADELAKEVKNLPGGDKVAEEYRQVKNKADQFADKEDTIEELKRCLLRGQE